MIIRDAGERKRFEERLCAADEVKASAGAGDGITTAYRTLTPLPR